MSISIGDAILYISGDDSKLRKALKSAESAYDQFERNTGRAVNQATRMQAGDWFMLDAAAKRTAESVKATGQEMEGSSVHVVGLGSALKLLSGQMGTHMKFIGRAGLTGAWILAGTEIVKAASNNDRLSNSLDRLTSKLIVNMGHPLTLLREKLDLVAEATGRVVEGLADISDSAEFRAKEATASKSEAEAKRRNREAKEGERTRNIGLIKRPGIAQDPRMDEISRQAHELAMAQTGLGILGGMGGVSREEQAQMNMANQLGNQEQWRQQRLGKRNLALEDLLKRKKGALTGAFNEREAARGQAFEQIGQEAGGDPGEAREFLAGFAEWFQNASRGGNTPRGNAAQVVNQYITISHANLALGEKQKAAYNLRRSTMPGVS